MRDNNPLHKKFNFQNTNKGKIVKEKIYKVVSVLLFLMGGMSSAHAGFMGRELSVGYFVPDQTTPYDDSVALPSTFMVADGVDAVVNLENVTDIAIDVSDASILFDFTTTLDSPTLSPQPFSGLVFELLSGGPLQFLSFSIDPSSTLAGFDPSRVSFNDSQVTVNFQGLSYDSNTLLLINFQPAVSEVPEPGTMSLLGLGFLGALAMRRRRPPTTGRDTTSSGVDRRQADLS